MFFMDVLEQQLMFIGGSLLCACIGADTDVRECTIPNWVIGPAMAAGLMLPALHLVVISTAIAGGVFALAIGIHNRRLRETLRNVAELLDHHDRHGLKPHHDLTLSNLRTLRLPFALPIAAGCLFTRCTLAWEARP